MPNLELELPAGVGEQVLIHRGELAGQTALVIAWHAVRPRFLLGGTLDGEVQVTLVVIAADGAARWVDAADVTGINDPVVVSVSLPFVGGDTVRVAPTWAPGEVRGWEVIGRRLVMQVLYRVHMHDAPPESEIAVDAVLLQPWFQT